MLLRDGCERRVFVVSMSWSQPGAWVLVGSVIRKIIGIRPAWKRKYLLTLAK